MKKRRKIDFVIEDNDFYKIIFRFYPRLSTCHSFNDNPPKSWDGVYKVYYYYRVIKIYKDEDGHFHEILFDSDCDECSLLDEVAARCKYLSEGKTEVLVDYKHGTHMVQLLDKEFFPFADGIFWKIREGYSDGYFIEMFRKDDVGYRLYLKKDQIGDFGRYLQNCCDYMLEHGDPI